MNHLIKEQLMKLAMQLPRFNWKVPASQKLEKGSLLLARNVKKVNMMVKGQIKEVTVKPNKRYPVTKMKMIVIDCSYHFSYLCSMVLKEPLNTKKNIQEYISHINGRAIEAEKLYGKVEQIEVTETLKWLKVLNYPAKAGQLKILDAQEVYEAAEAEKVEVKTPVKTSKSNSALDVKLKLANLD